MTDFLKLAAGIASQLDGVIRPSGPGADDAPSGSDIAWIDLQHEREGLRVILRRLSGSESTRLRASMGLTAAGKAGADYRETPDFYKLETAAALSRGPDVIARQIESKIVQPALPMLEAWQIKLRERAAMQAGVEAAAARYQAAFPTARITVGKGEADFYLARVDGGYIQGDINEHGGLYVRRVSRLPESAAVALINALVPDTYRRGRSDYARIRDLASDPRQTPAQVTFAELEEMRDCVPPIYVPGVPGFLVGEALTGDARGTVYANYYESRDGIACARYYCLKPETIS